MNPHDHTTRPVRRPARHGREDRLPRPARRLARDVDGERGSASLFLVITMLGLLVLAGLVVDGGAKLRATQRADHAAAEAARAAGQAINLPAAIDGAAPGVDARAAVAAATAHLTATGVTGTVTVTEGGTTLSVTTSETAPTVFLGLIGITTLPVTGHATVTLVHGITGAGA